jgi:hypothetical protein
MRTRTSPRDADPEGRVTAVRVLMIASTQSLLRVQVLFPGADVKSTRQ